MKLILFLKESMAFCSALHMAFEFEFLNYKKGPYKVVYSDDVKV